MKQMIAIDERRTSEKTAFEREQEVPRPCVLVDSPAVQEEAMADDNE